MKQWLAVFLILSLGVTALSGCGKDAEYAWVLVETQTNEEEWQTQLARENEDSFIQHEVDVAENSAVFVTTYIWETDNPDDYAYAYGDRISGKVIWDAPPPVIAGPEFEFSLQGTVELIDRTGLDGRFALHGYHEYLGADDSVLRTGGLINETGENFSDRDNNYATCHPTFSGKLDWGSEEDGRSLIVLIAEDFKFKVITTYIYEWQEQ